MESIKKLSLDDRATQEALDQIYITSKVGIGGHFVLVLLLSFILLDKVSLAASQFIFISHVVILIWRTYIVLNYLKIRDSIVEIESINHWLNFYKFGTFMTGVAWGMTFFFLSDLPTEYHFIIFSVVVGVAAAGILTIGVVFSIYVSFIFPMF